MRDLLIAIRRLRATPIFTLFAVVSLALGLGVTTAFYSVIYSLLWKPIGVVDQGQLAFVTRYPPTLTSWRGSMSHADFGDLAAAQTSFSGLAAWSGFAHTLSDGPISEFVSGEAVNGGYFETLGVRAALGRALHPDDDTADAASVIVIHDRFWRRKLSADAGIVGRTVALGGLPVTVVGIVGDRFNGITDAGFGQTDVWMPFAAVRRLTGALVPPELVSANRDRRWISVVGRLRPDVVMVQAQAELRVLSARLDQVYPVRQRTGNGLESIVVPREWSTKTADDVHAGAIQGVSNVGVAMIALVALVLLVASTNLANLMLARGASRRQEMAISRALGASRWRLVSVQLTEAGLIASAGGLGAYLLTRLALTWTSTELPIGPGRIIAFEPTLNQPVLAAAAVALLIALLIFGVWPAWRLTGRDVRPVLANDSAETGAPRWRIQRSLISWQVTVSVGFFLMAAMCIRALYFDRDFRPMGSVGDLAVANVTFDAQLPSASVREDVDEILTLLRRRPELGRAFASAGVPAGWPPRTPSAHVTTSDRPFSNGSSEEGRLMGFVAATPEIFEVLELEVRQGRTFETQDVEAGQRVAVLSQTAASTLFGTLNAVGRQVLHARDRGPRADARTVETATVVGVVADVAPGGPGRQAIMYVPLGQHGVSTLSFVVRSPGQPAVGVAALRSAIRTAAPGLTVTLAGTGTLVLAPAAVAFGAITNLATGLGVLALLLSMIGLYGVLSHLVARRTREMGVRMALGATPARVLTMVLVDGFKPVLDGLALGLIAGVVGRLILRAVFPQPVSLIDPVAFAVVPIPLGLAALLACYLPARRASRVPPNVALRQL